MCPCLIPFRFFYSQVVDSFSVPLCLGTESSVDFLVTSEIDMIGSACVNVQAGERGWHVGVSQVTHVNMQYEVVSLAQIPTRPHY